MLSKFPFPWKSAGFRLDGHLRDEVPVVEVRLVLRVALLGPVARGAAALDVVPLHQLTVVTLPLRALPLALRVRGLGHLALAAEREVGGLVTAGHAGLGAGRADRPLLAAAGRHAAARQHGGLRGLLRGELLRRGLGLHLLPQQRNVLNALQLTRVPEKPAITELERAQNIF